MEMKKKNKKISKIVGYVISMLCLVLCIFVTVEVIQANKESRPPRIFGISVSYVPTESMEPTIPAGSYVMFKEADFSEVKQEDIIVYRNSNDMFIIHRVKEKYDDYLVTKGDNNDIPDTERITPDMVYGKYIMNVEFLSIFSGGISQNSIFIVLIVIFIIMIIMQTVSVFVKAKTEKNNQEKEQENKRILEELKQEILKEELEKLKKIKQEDKEE